MAKNSGEEKFPFFQEARLETTVCIRFRSTHLRGAGSSAISYKNNLKTKNSALKGLIFSS